jgi:hypothetical protein
VQKIRGPFHKSLGALGWIVVKLESLLKNRRLRKYFAERFKGSSVKTRGLRGSTLLTERTFCFLPSVRYWPRIRGQSSNQRNR